MVPDLLLESVARPCSWIAGAITLMLIPMLLVTGSRAGIAIGFLGLASAVLIAPLRFSERVSSRWRGLVRWAMLIGPIAIGAVVFALGRATALQRLFAGNVGEDARVQLTPTSLTIAKDFFPFGIGFGSFDPVFRIFEPNWSLDRTYFNHAHNDFLEIIITAGAPGAVLLAVVLIWFIRRSINLWRTPISANAGPKLQRGAFFMLLIVMLASVVDYPLRTPLMSGIVAIAAVWFMAASGLTAQGSGGVSRTEAKLPLRL